MFGGGLVVDYKIMGEFEELFDEAVILCGLKKESPLLIG